MSETLTRDNLIAGNLPVVSEEATIKANAGVLARGTVLGKITKGAATKAAVTGGNTGNGTCTLNVTTPILAKAKPGIYKVRVIRAAVAGVATSPAVPAEKAIAQLQDPDGKILETFEVATTPGTTVANQVMFVIVDGSTAYVVGDGWDITIAAGSGYLDIVLSTAINGTEAPVGVLLETLANSGSIQGALIAATGEFSENALVYGGADTIATHRDALRALGIFAKATLAA